MFPRQEVEHLQDLPSSSCAKCKKALNSESEAIQCDSFYVWMHDHCEGVSKDKCNSLNEQA